MHAQDDVIEFITDYSNLIGTIVSNPGEEQDDLNVADVISLSANLFTTANKKEDNRLTSQENDKSFNSKNSGYKEGLLDDKNKKKTPRNSIFNKYGVGTSS